MVGGGKTNKAKKPRKSVGDAKSPKRAKDYRGGGKRVGGEGGGVIPRGPQSPRGKR